MKVLSKHEAEFELLKVVAKAIEGSGCAVTLADELEEQGAPEDLIDSILETSASIVMDEAREAIQNILKGL